MNATLASTEIVVDANLAVWAVLPTRAAVNTIPIFRQWRRQEIQLVAPELWLAESVSAIRRMTHARMISTEQGRTAIEDLFGLEVETRPLSIDLCQSAFAWADRLGQAQAYDGCYLALAEALQAEFWTGDIRLANAAHQAGAAWVRGVR